MKNNNTPDRTVNKVMVNEDDPMGGEEKTIQKVLQYLCAFLFCFCQSFFNFCLRDFFILDFSSYICDTTGCFLMKQGKYEFITPFKMSLFKVKLYANFHVYKFEFEEYLRKGKKYNFRKNNN